MKIISDLHIHSRFSRATSKQLNIENLEKYARIKGLNLLGTSDFTHPEWIQELKQQLTEDGTGIPKTKNNFPFILQTEISLIYTQENKGRRVHIVLMAKNFDVVNQITEYLKTKGRVDYDGRPIFKIPCDELTESMKKIDDGIEVIPAHCLTPDSYIHTKNQIKKIKEIKEKDLVLTHKGAYKQVKKVYTRKFSGEVIQIVPSCLKVGSYFTPEHPILSIKTYKLCKNVPHTICKPNCAYLKRECKKREFQNYKTSWNQIRDIEKGDIILYPRYNKTKDREFIYLDKIIDKSFREEDYIKPKDAKVSIKNAPVKNRIKVSKDFCRLMGYYLAEGYCTRDNIGFTFSQEEHSYIKDVKNLLTNIFGEFVKTQIRKEKSKGISIIVHSKILKELFKVCYTEKPYRAFNKSLPNWFIDLPKDKLKELLIGWWRGDSGYTTSRNLHNQFKLMLTKLGIIPSINITKSEDVNIRRKIKVNKIGQREIVAKHDIFHFHNLSFFNDCCGIDKLPEFSKFITKLKRRKGWIDKNYMYLPIIKINKKKYSGLVYNLEVEKDNSYLTENLAVHNCWTPWFSLFGSMSGFNSVEDCFKDQTKHIHALETGLSSDPAMNWRLSQLDKYSLVSSSDLHSFWPWRIGREATIFDLKELTYNNIIKALKTKEGLEGTIEVDPNYGKYHFDGHRNCKICMNPKDSIKVKNICPKCGRSLTIGVLHRIEELADREEGFKPKDAKPFSTLIPLSEIISTLIGSPVASKKTWKVYNDLIEKFKNELNIMLDADKEELTKVTDEKIADGIIKNREGKIMIQPGFDGEYGRPLFSDKDKVEIKTEKPKFEQKGLGDF